MKNLLKFLGGVCLFPIGVVFFAIWFGSWHRAPWHVSWGSCLLGVGSVVCGLSLTSKYRDQARKLLALCKEPPVRLFTAGVICTGLVSGAFCWSLHAENFWGSGDAWRVLSVLGLIVFAAVGIAGLCVPILTPDNWRWARWHAFFWDEPNGPWHFPETKEQRAGLSCEWVNNPKALLATLARGTFAVADDKACWQGELAAAQKKSYASPQTLYYNQEVGRAEEYFKMAKKTADRHFKRYYRLCKLLVSLDILPKNFNAEAFRQTHKPKDESSQSSPTTVESEHYPMTPISSLGPGMRG